MSPPVGRPGPRARARAARERGEPPAPAHDAHRWTVAIDFDGVLHAYTSGWQGEDVIPDPPVPGAMAWLEDLAGHFELAIFSTRCRTAAGRWAMYEWLAEKISPDALLRVSFAEHKPAALVYVDDRAYRFDGANFPTPELIWKLKPWGVAAKIDTSLERRRGVNAMIDGEGARLRHELGLPEET